MADMTQEIRNEINEILKLFIETETYLSLKSVQLLMDGFEPLYEKPMYTVVKPRFDDGGVCILEKKGIMNNNYRVFELELKCNNIQALSERLLLDVKDHYDYDTKQFERDPSRKPYNYRILCELYGRVCQFYDRHGKKQNDSLERKNTNEEMLKDLMEILKSFEKTGTFLKLKTVQLLINGFETKLEHPTYEIIDKNGLLCIQEMENVITSDIHRVIPFLDDQLDENLDVSELATCLHNDAFSHYDSFSFRWNNMMDDEHKAMNKERYNDVCELYQKTVDFLEKYGKKQGDSFKI